jgi:small-conductance mechanosensitive channel
MLSLTTTRRRSWLAIILFALILSGPGARAAAADGIRQGDPRPLTIAPTPVAEVGAPVIVNDEVLFRIQTRLGSISPTERAALISEHISRLANNPFVSEIVITVIDSEGMTDVVAGEDIIVTVTDADAAAEGRERQELAQEWATAVQSAIIAGQSSQGGQALATGLAISFAILLVLVVLIWLVDRLADWLVDKLDPSTGPARLPRTLARSEFYQTGQFSRLVRALLRAFKVILAILLITVAIPLVLRSFSQTRELGERLIQMILAPLAILWDSLIESLPNIIFLLVLATLTWLAIKLTRLFFREVERGVIRLPSFEPEWAGFTAKMATFLLVIIAIIIGFTSLPLSRTPVFQGISAFLALLITLSSTSAIANIIAGIILTYTGAFKLGDIISIQTTQGEVVGKYLLTTRIRTAKNENVSIPNSLVLSTSVTNFSRMAKSQGLALHTTVTVGYNVPWQQVHELLIAAALDCEHTLKEPAPFVLQTSLNDYHVSYELNAYTMKPEILPRLYSDLHRAIQTRFNAAGVEIMSPNYLALRDGNDIAVPPDSLPPGYQAPAFRIKNTSGE